MPAIRVDEMIADNQTTDVDRSRCCGDVLMIQPKNFGFNSETAASNAFQTPPTAAAAEIQRSALAEFDGLVEALTSHGVRVWVMDDADRPRKPDAVFPNNWVSFHADGTVVIYPLEARSRRAERRPDLITRLANTGRFRVSRVVDLSYLEERARYLEGTGSLVLDRAGRVAYAGLSSRTHPEALAVFGREVGFEFRKGPSGTASTATGGARPARGHRCGSGGDDRACWWRQCPLHDRRSFPAAARIMVSSNPAGSRAVPR